MTQPPVSTRIDDVAVDIFELFDLEGARHWSLVIKQRWRWDPRTGRLDRIEGATVSPVDVPWPDFMSPKFPSDLFLRKPGADVVVVGHAVAASPVPELDVSVSVGPVTKALRVFGPRVWYRGVVGVVPSAPEKMERQALMWEDAYGGMDISNPEKIADEPRNPYGRGVAGDPKVLEHQPVPSIEDPRDLIRSARTKPAPAGVAAIGPNFEPRRSLAGTFDQKWQDERMPLLPLDFDWRHNQVAHPELVAPSLRGDEPIAIMNIGWPGVQRTFVPRTVYQVDAIFDRGQAGFRPVLDTIVLMPDEHQMDVVHRTSIPIRRAPENVREVHVYEKRILRA